MSAMVHWRGRGKQEWAVSPPPGTPGDSTIQPSAPVCRLLTQLHQITSGSLQPPLGIRKLHSPPSRWRISPSRWHLSLFCWGPFLHSMPPFFLQLLHSQARLLSPSDGRQWGPSHFNAPTSTCVTPCPPDLYTGSQLPSIQMGKFLQNHLTCPGALEM